jgi:hypothetical protein
MLHVLSESRKLPANPEACFKAAEEYMTDAMADDRKPDEPALKKLLKGKW